MVWNVQIQFNCYLLIQTDLLTGIKPLDGSLKGLWEGQVFTAPILDSLDSFGRETIQVF